MNKQFSLLQLFSIVDGRLSTNMDDVYSILDHVCNEQLMTHHLPVARQYVLSKNPKWIQELVDKYTELKCTKDTDFKICFDILKSNDRNIDIPQLKDEFDTSDFGDYMVNKSLLLKRLE